MSDKDVSYKKRVVSTRRIVQCDFCGEEIIVRTRVDVINRNEYAKRRLREEGKEDILLERPGKSRSSKEDGPEEKKRKLDKETGNVWDKDFSSDDSRGSFDWQD